MKHFRDVYLKVDVLLLACASEAFMEKTPFELDPAHYLSTPGYN